MHAKMKMLNDEILNMLSEAWNPLEDEKNDYDTVRIKSDEH
jgi:hypothetical protein